MTTQPKTPQTQKHTDPRQPYRPNEKTTHTAITAALGITMALIFGTVGMMDYHDAKMAADFKMPVELTKGLAKRGMNSLHTKK